MRAKHGALIVSVILKNNVGNLNYFCVIGIDVGKGQLVISDYDERELYLSRRALSAGRSYFLFQAQRLDLPTLSAGQVLAGHIVESRIGQYEPHRRIVTAATFRVEKVLLNIPNPFFANETVSSAVRTSSEPLRQGGDPLSDLLRPREVDKKHCCDTGKKPCWWKC